MKIIINYTYNDETSAKMEVTHEDNEPILSRIEIAIFLMRIIKLLVSGVEA